MDLKSTARNLHVDQKLQNSFWTDFLWRLNTVKFPLSEAACLQVVSVFFGITSVLSHL